MDDRAFCLPWDKNFALTPLGQTVVYGELRKIYSRLRFRSKIPLCVFCVSLRTVRRGGKFESDMSAEPGRKTAYSNDLRWRIVYQRIAMNLPLVKIAQNLNVAVSTVHRIYRLSTLTCLFSIKSTEP